MKIEEVLHVVGVLIVPILLLFGLIKGPSQFLVKEYSTFESPQGNYKIVVQRFQSLFASMPGQGSDTSGLVQLFDRQNHLLREAKVEMVQLIDRVKWEEDRVRIKLIADWNLPTLDIRTFDIRANPRFKNYENLIEQYARKHRPRSLSDFCILGLIGRDKTQLAWILWQQGQQIILWEGSDQPSLDLSQTLSIKTDMVQNENDLQGSTHLVTRSWVESLKSTCDQAGIKVQTGQLE